MTDKVVYILGAGFSHPFGIPLMSNFIEKSKDLYFDDRNKFEDFPKIFNMIDKLSVSKNYYNSDLHNIEEILSILEMQNQINYTRPPKNKFTKYIKEVIENSYLPELIEINSRQGIIRPNKIFHNNINSLHNLYGYFLLSMLNSNYVSTNSVKFFQRNSDNCLNYNIITLNYDTILESHLNYISRYFTYDQEPWFSSSNYENQQLLNIAKLHGCITRHAEIISPTWNKNISNNVRNSWKFAHKALTEANHIRFIGYSLPESDSYIKFLLKSAIINSDYRNLKSIDVICMDYDDNVKRRYEKFIDFHNFRFKNTDTESYLKYLTKPYLDYHLSHSNEERIFKFDKLEVLHKLFFNNV